MKYLFFDIECASVHHGSKMCSFGYVLADENLNIIESKDIIMNPKSEWDWYVLENILDQPKEYYESFPSFEEQYEDIRDLFGEDVIAFGHGVTNDVRFINEDCKRYNLPYIDFAFYDCADIYKEFENAKEVKSLAKVSKEIGEHTQGEKHKSKEDAFLTYEYTKEMCEQMDTSLSELLQLVPNCKGINKNGNCTYRNIKRKESKTSKNPGKLYECFLQNVKPNQKCENKFLEGKKIAISINYEKKNFKPMLLIIQLITNLGGTYVTSGKDADVFVTTNGINKRGFADYCDREFEVDKAIEEGRDIEKLNIYEFLGIIGYDEDEIENNYRDVCRKIVKIIRKEERENKKVKVK